MVIRRKNFVATMDFFFTTLIEKFLKKDVAILFFSVVTMIKQMAIEFCLKNQIYVVTERAVEGKIFVVTKENYVTTKIIRAMRQVKTNWS